MDSSSGHRFSLELFVARCDRAFVLIIADGNKESLAAYHFSLIRQRDPARCFKAFLHNNWIGASIFAGIALDLLRQSGLG